MILTHLVIVGLLSGAGGTVAAPSTAVHAPTWTAPTLAAPVWIAPTWIATT